MFEPEVSNSPFGDLDAFQFHSLNEAIAERLGVAGVVGAGDEGEEFHEDSVPYTQSMEGSWLDSIPSYEQKKLRKMMSAEAYERLREKVKGPEDLEREMKKSEQLAELSFDMQTSEKTREAVHQSAEKGIAEQGAENVVDQTLSPEAKKALEQGKFKLAVSHHPKTGQDQLVAVSEGNVQEKIPLKQSFSDQIVAQFLQSASPSSSLQNLRKRSQRKKA